VIDLSRIIVAIIRRSVKFDGTAPCGQDKLGLRAGQRLSD
jgi:hypothetical protein